ncbi:MAG: protein kinase domain-containing protein [Pyrinomonadaceae bacterium]
MTQELSTNSTLSHYRIVSKIGAGGMGEVYLAQDTKLDRRVALKVLPAEVASNRDRMERFVREAKAAAALNHPNIAQIFEISEHDGIHFIAMEFVDGVTLRQKIHSERTELRTLLRHLQHVAQGLAKAHTMGIVHRDLKPDNIMITHDGHAKILDFGLAKLLETRPESAGESGEAATAMMPVQHSTPGVVMGTVGYMSPEQAQAKRVDQRSDIFSFGCILYEAVTGRKPFAGDSIVDTLHKIIHEPAPSIADLNPAAPAELQRIIRKCLAKEPAKRYQTIRDVANDLDELIEELKGLSDIERSVAPSSQSQHASASGVAGATTADSEGVQSTAPLSQPASSAEFIATGIRQHKLGVALLLAILVGAISVLGYYLYSRSNKGTIGSIAVLPFQNRNSDADTEYLSDGLAESLIYRLSQLPNLKVSPTSSVLRYKGQAVDAQKIAAELNVDAVMSGRLVQRGEDLTISVELIDARNNKLLWGEQYERKMTDLLATQREIASTIAEKLQLKLSATDDKGITKRYTNDNEAYQLYLKGRYYWNRRTAENLKKAIEQFKSATDRDSNFALAFGGLADCYAVLSEYAGTPTSETLPKSRAYAERALAIDGQLAEPHATLGAVNEYSWQWADAEKEFKRAIELNPNYPTTYHWYSIFLKAEGRNEEAAAIIKRAQELDPLSSVIAVNISRMYQLQNNHDASIENSLKLIELDPNFGPAYQYLALSYLKRGRNAEAIAAAEKAVNLTNRSGITLGDLGYVYAASGKRAGVIDIIGELEDKYARNEAIGQHMATVYVGLGDTDKAFEWLERDFQARNGRLAEIRWQTSV